MSTIILLLVFVAALVIGYKVLSHIPSLLHTPLMSSMNALDGVIILGAFLGGCGIALAVTNVFGGFDITHKMLKMIAGKKR